jgi:cobalt/nickel transport system permease protein
MHIPDGYLGPHTYLPAFGIMLPLWAVALRKVRETLRLRQVPMLALGAAFSFVIMMFNVPAPGGTTGHAVGAALVAILLGPWAAVIGVSLALVVQALVYGDGGVTAIAANCLTMGVVMPFVSWWVYRLLVGNSPTLARQGVAGAVAGYVGLNAAAFVTAVLFGIQPYIAPGQYMPFDLRVAVPVMMGEHLLFFGFVEAAVTGMVLVYLRRTAPDMVPETPMPTPDLPVAPSAPAWKRLAFGLLVLALLSPLGLLATGTAWGEWGRDEIEQLAGHVPTGFARMAELWRPPLADYTAPVGDHPAFWVSAIWYIVSAALGIAAIAAIVLGARRLLAKPVRHGS